MEIKDILG